MEKTWRGFEKKDKITLAMLQQIGAVSYTHLSIKTTRKRAT